MDTFDIVILGGGAGAKMIWGSVPGRSVAVVEQSRVGGECPFVACVPSKAMLRSGEVWHLAAEEQFSALFTGRIAGADAYREAVQRRDRIVNGRDDSLNAAGLAKSGATLLRGTGHLVRPGVVSVAGEEIGYRDLVLDTGSMPVVPDLPGLDRVPAWTSDEALSTSELPSSMVVLGGGPVGCELAFLFATFGIAVTLVQSNRRLIPREEIEASEEMLRVLLERGVRVHVDARAVGAEPAGAGVGIQLADGRAIEADRLVLAVGRAPRSSGLGLDAAGGHARQGRLLSPSMSIAGSSAPNMSGPSVTSPGPRRSPTPRTTKAGSSPRTCRVTMCTRTTAPCRGRCTPPRSSPRSATPRPRPVRPGSNH